MKKSSSPVWSWLLAWPRRSQWLKQVAARPEAARLELGTVLPRRPRRVRPARARRVRLVRPHRAVRRGTRLSSVRLTRLTANAQAASGKLVR
jgi:hypothetical protein